MAFLVIVFAAFEQAIPERGEMGVLLIPVHHCTNCLVAIDFISLAKIEKRFANLGPFRVI